MLFNGEAVSALCIAAIIASQNASTSTPCAATVRYGTLELDMLQDLEHVVEAEGP